MSPRRKGTNSSVNKLARSISGGMERDEYLRLRTAVVTAVNTGTNPWTVTLNLDGIIISSCTFLGWANPQVGEVVQVLQQGPSLLVLGAVGPARVFTGAAPAPAALTPELQNPTVPPQSKMDEVSIEAVSSSTGPSELAAGGWRTGDLHQGGNIHAQRGYWFYGSRIATAKGTGTIVGGFIFIRRENRGGTYAESTIRLGAHNFSTRPTTPPTDSLAAVTEVGALERGRGATYAIPEEIIARFNAGTARGLGLEPGGFENYLIASGFGSGTEWSGALTLTIQR